MEVAFHVFMEHGVALAITNALPSSVNIVISRLDNARNAGPGFGTQTAIESVSWHIAVTTTVTWILEHAVLAIQIIGVITAIILVKLKIVKGLALVRNQQVEDAMNVKSAAGERCVRTIARTIVLGIVG